MPEKPKKRDRREIHTMLAAVSLTLLLAVWNTIANHDRHKVEAASPSASITAAGSVAEACATPSVARMNTGGRCMTVTRTRSS